MVQCITAAPDVLGNYWEDPAFRPIVDASLVLWVTSDFGNSGTWTDLSGLGNHGTIYGGAARTPLHPLGIFGSALSFDGVDDYVEVADNDSLEGMSALTIAFWMKPNSLSATFVPISKFSATTGYSYQIYVDPSSFGMDVQSGGITEELASTAQRITANEWNYIVGNYDSSRNPRFKLYVNGVETDSGGTSGGNVDASTTPLSIGRGKPEVGYYLDGTIGEVEIYRRGLSGVEIIHNYTHSPIYYIQRGLV